MAIAEDATTPAVVTAASLTGLSADSVTTAAFSPPSGAWLVALVNIGYTSGGDAPVAVTVSDTAGHIWGNPVFIFDGNTNYAGIFTTRLASAPGSITVTATNTDLPTYGMQLATRVVTGAAASQAGQASSSSVVASTLNMDGSITTTQTGSWVYVVETNDTSGLTYTPVGVTNIGMFDDTADNEGLHTGRQTSATSTPGPVTLGWTTGSAFNMSWVALEILLTSQGPVPQVVASMATMLN